MGEDGGKKERSVGLGRLIAGLVVLAILFVIAVFIFIRTETGKDSVRSWMEKELGMELTIESASMALPFELVLDRVESRDYVPGEKPGFKAREIRIVPGLFSPSKISVLRGDLTLERNGSGKWLPAGFARIGDIPLRDITEISRATHGLRRDAIVHVADSSIVWMDEHSEEIATASGILFDMTPVAIPDKNMYYYHLVVYNMLGTDGVRVHDVEREWLSSDLQDYVEIHRSGKPIPATGRSFWEVSEK